MDCKLRAKNCGGCPLLGLDYAEQLKQKEESRIYQIRRNQLFVLGRKRRCRRESEKGDKN